MSKSESLNLNYDYLLRSVVAILHEFTIANFNWFLLVFGWTIGRHIDTELPFVQVDFFFISTSVVVGLIASLAYVASGRLEQGIPIVPIDSFHR